MGRRPTLKPGMKIDDFRELYWMKADLVAFARRLGLVTHGYKPELVKRIERRLRGLADASERPRELSAPRDSERPLRRSTRVVNYKSDDKTRAFFTSHIGPHFHFTSRLNQYRLARKSLTYGDLIDEWIVEHERRKRPGYKAPLLSHGEYNRHIRDFFADKRNQGKKFQDAVNSWKAAKQRRGDRRYK